LTGGEAHDCPIAGRLIRRVKPPKRMLGDKAYDSAELREQLDECGTKPVIPNRSNRKQPFSFSKRRITQQSPVKDKMAFPFSGTRGPDPLKRIFFWGTTILPPTGVDYIDRTTQRNFDKGLQRPYPADKSNGGEAR